ncbi:MAG: transcription elongation factor [Bacteroidota bacterium]|nr:transcription elongation factor [Bacteroidota bacterium]MDP3145764.1 transcription elongation factor [Bacteroidota bacterium]MDP3556827.1 transcription elongation factor [Bacteroidota bacterium]
MIELKSPADKLAFKKLVKSECIKQINQRIDNAKAAVSQAQEAANSSDKSTAGDKYETSRAMGQLDSDMNTKQLLEAEQELGFLEKVEVNNLAEEIKIGSIFEMSDILFFVAIGLGPIKIDDKRVMVVSSKSPFYENIKTMKAGNVFEFMDKMDQIKMVF